MWKKPDVPTPSSVQKEVVCLSLQRAFCFVVGFYFLFLSSTGIIAVYGILRKQ